MFDGGTRRVELLNYGSSRGMLEPDSNRTSPTLPLNVWYIYQLKFEDGVSTGIIKDMEGNILYNHTTSYHSDTLDNYRLQVHSRNGASTIIVKDIKITQL
jgi:hypothetical protein